MNYKNLVKKLTAVAITATMTLTATAFSVSATEVEETDFVNESDVTASTQPVEEAEGYSLTQQTITDEDTGVVISGLLPENANLDVRIRMWDSELINDIEEPNKFSDKRFSAPTFDDLQNNNYNSKENFYDEDWINPNYLADAGAYVPQVDIVFYDAAKVIDFESELTVTLPIDYRAFAQVKESDSNVMVFKSYPEENTIKGLKVLSKEESPEGSLVFETDSTGTFFVGNEEYMNQFLYFFDSSLENVEVYENTDAPESTEPTEVTEPTIATESTESTEAATTADTEKATENGKSSPKTGHTVPVSVMIAGLVVVLTLMSTTTMLAVKLVKRNNH